MGLIPDEIGVFKSQIKNVLEELLMSNAPIVPFDSIGATQIISITKVFQDQLLLDER